MDRLHFRIPGGTTLRVESFGGQWIVGRYCDDMPIAIAYEPDLEEAILAVSPFRVGDPWVYSILNEVYEKEAA